MTFLSLNDVAKGYLLALCIIAVVIQLITLIAYLSDRYKSRRVVMLLFLNVFSILMCLIITQLNKFGREKYDILMTPVYEFFNGTPYFVYVIINMSVIFFAVFSLYALYKKNKTQINVFSVKQALETLPCAVAFMTDDEELLLSNRIMHNLCKELTGAPLRNAEHFWSQINSMQGDNRCAIKGAEPTFILADGKVWQFSKSRCIHDGEEYCEYRADDITELYKLRENIHGVNEQLKQQQNRLKTLSDIIEDNAKNQVAVNMRINFHDNFGNLLTLTKKTLRESEDEQEVRTLINYWKNLNGVIKDLSGDDRQTITLRQVMLFADKLGSKINIVGEIPAQDYDRTTTLLCINEMLKNAYRHAGAQELSVNILSQNSSTIITIHNKTKDRISQITEGGGLSGLRSRIEQSGGEMDMSCDDGVTMTIKLLREIG